jgi:hypothetical protein
MGTFQQCGCLERYQMDDQTAPRWAGDGAVALRGEWEEGY